MAYDFFGGGGYDWLQPLPYGSNDPMIPGGIPSVPIPGTTPPAPPSNTSPLRTAPQTTSAPAPAAPTVYQPMAGWEQSKLNTPTENSIKYQFGRFVQDQGYNPTQARTQLGDIVARFNQLTGANARTVAGKDDLIDFGIQGWDPIDVLRSDNQWQWLTNVTTPQGQIMTPIGRVTGQAPGAPMMVDPSVGLSVSGSGNVFTDPATSEWERLLRILADRLQNPQPDLTAQQTALQQSQLLDPLERQRQAQRQQVIQRLAARGIAPSSGIAEQALQDVDRQFNELRTTTQANLTQQGLQRMDQRFAGNEQRALQALSLMSQIPQLADARLQLARAGLTETNPAQLINLQHQLQNQQWQQNAYNQQQQQQFWQQLAQIIGGLF